ncbi:helix-turn-helix domain-containing protein [Bacillus sp. JJ1566]|uniref:helix-turn-helix domain-containing protein n=1 Tax=Bacillus sp. JJ1566 TaxID=3122961 RepID=UPI002FFEFF56
MELTQKREKLMKKIDNHLRTMARHLVTFDTIEETLDYLLNGFYKEYACDLVGVVLYEKGRLVPKVWKGEQFTIDQTLHLDVSDCSPKLLKNAIWWQKDKREETNCAFHTAIKNENLSTWFTVPLHNLNESFGLCVIGFREFIPLIIEAEQIFTEFGHDVASSLVLAREKESQKRKMKGIEWIKENILPNSSIDHIIEKVVERACKGTQASGACVYLYDEENTCFDLHPPWYGPVGHPIKIKINSNKSLDSYFPFVEIPGGTELTVPLLVNLKTIGVIYVTTGGEGNFTEEDLEFLKFVSDFVSMQIENARLYKFEYESKKSLETILEHQQELVKKTVKGADLVEITTTISPMIDSTVFLYDRFMNPITSKIKGEEKHLQNEYQNEIMKMKNKITKLCTEDLQITLNNTVLHVLPILQGNKALGYLIVSLYQKKMHRLIRLTIDYVINVYAIEFIKQKLVLDTKEQIQEGFVNQLFTKSIENPEKIIQYATLTNWNILEPHTVVVGSFFIEDDSGENVVAIEAKKSRIWEQVKSDLSFHFKNIIFSRKSDDFIIIVQTPNEQNFWKRLYSFMFEVTKKEKSTLNLFVGIGGNTTKLEDYYDSYIKATKAKNVIMNRNPNGGYALYDNLGAYTILSNTSDVQSARIFIKKNLGVLVQYSEKNNVDLFGTLRVFLLNNGNVREASNALYIHRSTLEYRIDRIAELLDVDLNDAEVRFELLIAYKLYNLFGFNSSELM